MPFILKPTDGMNSRVRKINNKQAARIKTLFAQGKRGKDYAKRFGISASQFNKIGRGEMWKVN